MSTRFALEAYVDKDKDDLVNFLREVGFALGFEVRKEVQASESAWVDLVWFDKKLLIPAGKKSFNMRRAPVLPVVGFEVEFKTGLDAKHVKGSVSNLSNLNAQLSIIVIGQPNLDYMKAKPPYKDKDDEKVKETLRDRVYRWVYAEAQPKCRIIVMLKMKFATGGKTLLRRNQHSLP